MADCWPCAPQRKNILITDWDLPSLNAMVDPTGLFKICDKHLTEFSEEVKKREAELPELPKKYVLKDAVKQFLPPIQKEPIKNYNEPREREANDGSLIE